MRPAPAVARDDSDAPAPTGAPAGSSAATPSPKPTPTPADSVDAQRERGAAAYEAAVKNLAGRLAALRGEVRRFNAQCPDSGGLRMGPNGAERVQGCDVPRDEINQLVGEIQTALDDADEAARRSWVDPGVRRSIRDRSGLDDVALGEALAAARAAVQR